MATSDHLDETDRQLVAAIERRPRSLRQLARHLDLPVDEVEERCDRLAAAGVLEIEEPTELERRILDAAGSRPMTAGELGEAVGLPAEDVAERCRSLRYYGELSSTVLDELDGQIFETLQDRGTVPTAKIAEEVGEASSRVYRRCQRLGGAFLGSARELGDRYLYFFPITGDVLTATSYPRVDEVVSHLKEIVDRHPIPRGAELADGLKADLRREYREYLHDLASRSEAGEALQIAAFETQLMGVLSGTRKSDVVGLFGLRRFRPFVRTWALRRVGNPQPAIPQVSLGTTYFFRTDGSFPGRHMPFFETYRTLPGRPIRIRPGKERRFKSSGTGGRDRRRKSSSRKIRKSSRSR